MWQTLPNHLMDIIIGRQEKQWSREEAGFRQVVKAACRYLIYLLGKLVPTQDHDFYGKEANLRMHSGALMSS